MKLDVLADAEAVAVRAAEEVARAIERAVAERGRCAVAFSGGRTPRRMFDHLAARELPWARVHVFQADERIAPAGDAARNWEQIRAHLVARGSAGRAQLHPMPVEADDLAAAAAQYARALTAACGEPPVLDLVHLGLGADGHTASLVPGDAVLGCDDADVAVTDPYEGHRRMTLTFPILGRARRRLFVVTGEDKRDALRKLLARDASIPAGRLPADSTRVLADPAAAP